jgi:hypothetical protein
MAKNSIDSSAKAANIASAISAGGDIAATAITLIAGISDQKKRAIYQSNFDALNLDQQQKLNALLLQSNSQTDRLAILAQALSSANAQRINNIANMYAEAERKERNKTLIIAGMLVIFGISAVYIVLKNK